ncbi:MAG: hypothetical protein ACREPM_21835, partial [Gemmatimonadaceae bacterium]
ILWRRAALDTSGGVGDCGTTELRNYVSAVGVSPQGEPEAMLPAVGQHCPRSPEGLTPSALT